MKSREIFLRHIQVRAVMVLQVLEVQVGAAQPLQVGEQRVMSGIRKRAARGPVAVGALGLAGDEQADLTVHGGLAKAVYAHPVEHDAFWREHRRALGLSTDLPYGSLLRVTQPRAPCYKLNAAMGDPTAVRTLARRRFECGTRPARIA